ncbi:fumarate hydratase [Kosmotoga arenicorallina S304]|uniref:Fumarate hydratase n=1 Tax=Kosmotoga arenicorallina S304 TaxID=1453497 RepID=A0A182C7M2_9BACT|nr:FumA C-terminus/TtdB family hydratase beta subunit [Kosmotoga arenicorallina]OAA31649.1 fumarate hydratase [Kosmotoga arenicorallina S304]
MKIPEFKVGEMIHFSGEFIVMRDAAQKRLREILETKGEIPLYLKEKIIFYAGPAKKVSGSEIGAIGPTTSIRMDPFLEMLLKLGVRATIGKGRRNDYVRELCQKYSALYFITSSGTAAALSKKVVKADIIAFPELGPEAVYRLEVEKFPLIVAIDSFGNSIYDRG